MMDYNASITYTLPVTAERRSAPSRPTTRAGSSACGARSAGAPTPAARATARSTRSSSTREHEVDLPQPGTITNYTIITPMQYPGQTETEPFARVHVLARRHRRRCSATSRCSTSPNDDVRIGMRVAAVWASEAEKADLASERRGQPPRLDADRRARRRRPRPREQDPVMPTLRRHRDHRLEHLADGAQHRQDRSPDAARGDHRRGRGRRHHPPARSTSPAPAAATTSPARRSRSCRTSTPSAPGRRSATRTSRWTARGRCTRRGSGCSSATSTSRWRWARGARRPPTPRSSTRWRWTRTTSPRSAPTRRRFAALQARALHRRGQGHRTADGRDRGPRAGATRRATRTRR